MRIFKLPIDVFYVIFEFLDPCSISRLAGCCKLTQDMIYQYLTRQKNKHALISLLCKEQKKEEHQEEDDNSPFGIYNILKATDASAIMYYEHDMLPQWIPDEFGYSHDVKIYRLIIQIWGEDSPDHAYIFGYEYLDSQTWSIVGKKSDGTIMKSGKNAIDEFMWGETLYDSEGFEMENKEKEKRYFALELVLFEK